MEVNRPKSLIRELYLLTFRYDFWPDFCVGSWSVSNNFKHGVEQDFLKRNGQFVKWN